MKTRLFMLEESHKNYRKYKSFVDGIEKTLAENSAVKFTESAKTKTITDLEFSTKLKLKAELLREGVPEIFRPSKRTIRIAEPLNKQNSIPLSKPQQTEQRGASVSATTPPKTNAEKPAIAQPKNTVPQSTERKDWLIPASEKTRDLQQHIEKELTNRGQQTPAPQLDKEFSPMRSAFNGASQNKPPEKFTTTEYVREKVREEAATIRKKMPPEFKAEPYPDDTPKSAKMSGAFNRAANSDTEKPSPNREPDYQP